MSYISYILEFWPLRQLLYCLLFLLFTLVTKVGLTFFLRLLRIGYVACVAFNGNSALGVEYI